MGGGLGIDLADFAGGCQRDQHFGDRLDRGLRVELAGGAVAEHCRAVEQQDPSHPRFERRLQIDPARSDEGRARDCVLGHGRADARDDLRIDRLHHGDEQALLAAEVVVQRALAQAGIAQKVFQRCVGETVLGEGRAGTLQQGPAGRFGKLCIAATGHLHLLPIDLHTVGM